jgi:hypothetical protein
VSSYQNGLPSDNGDSVDTRAHLKRHRGPNHDAECRACSRKITITPDGLELGHNRGKNGDRARCIHRPEACDPKGVGF